MHLVRRRRIRCGVSASACATRMGVNSDCRDRSCNPDHLPPTSKQPRVLVDTHADVRPGRRTLRKAFMVHCVLRCVTSRCPTIYCLTLLQARIDQATACGDERQRVLHMSWSHDVPLRALCNCNSLGPILAVIHTASQIIDLNLVVWTLESDSVQLLCNTRSPSAVLQPHSLQITKSINSGQILHDHDRDVLRVEGLVDW